MALCAGMQFDRREVALQQTKVLDDESIDTDVVKLVCHFDSRFEFFVEKESVERHKHLTTIDMGIADQRLDILETIGGRGTGAERRGSNIQGIGTMVDGLATEVEIFGRGKEFQLHESDNVPRDALLHIRTINTYKQRYTAMGKSKIIYGGLKGLDEELRRAEWADARYTIVVDENTFNHCLPQLVSNVAALQEAELVEIPSGEEGKSIEVATQVWQTLTENGGDRNTVIVNLGGGSICDLGGFVAAAYKRGIRHINIPTTLLAMADAAIGGKTAIDFGGIKNSIGFFHPASVVTLETGFLATLPQEELLNGMMEMVKTAAVTDASLYDILMHTSTLEPKTVKEVARMKARIVKADPYDHSIRHILNFGHTFGHAIEQYSTTMPHGIAVGIGMVAAMYLSMRKTGLDEKVYTDYRDWLRRAVEIPHYDLRDIEQMLPLMHHDKKNSHGETRCVLLQELGAAIIDVSVSDNEIRDTLLHLCPPTQQS